VDLTTRTDASLRARSYKNQNKARLVHHNRKSLRAKKVARGGF
jgi:hypothetical protein